MNDAAGGNEEEWRKTTEALAKPKDIGWDGLLLAVQVATKSVN